MTQVTEHDFSLSVESSLGMKKDNLSQAFLVLVLVANPSLVLAQAEQQNLDDSASTKSVVPLSQSLVGDVLAVEDRELTVGKNKGLLIKVRNTSDRPVVFDGGSAVAVVKGKQLQCSSLEQIQKAADPPTGIAKLAMRGTGAALSIGGIATLKDAIRNAGPVPNRYGGDERRRSDEYASFKKRALWPNDISEGYLFFVTGESLRGAEISLPVYTLYNDADKVVLKSIGTK
ncbi:MAG: hypothetical protein K2W82_04135 [Candidatus Obscuribacterales bacterium]|nr:hypothetical protein [Candidatus Obscuribacterales bacterium]